MNINLHIHSNNSDGKYSCEELVTILKNNNMDCVSLTDHDTMAGVPEFITLCNTNEIRCIPGVELSTRVKKIFEFIDVEFHILGYFPNYFDISYLYKVKLFKETAPSIKEAIDFIHQLKGYAVLAHPYNGLKLIFDVSINKNKYIKVKLDNVILEQLIELCKNYSIDGIEAFYENYSIEQINYLCELAKTYNLMTTIGTDFHRLGDVVIPKYLELKKENFLNRTLVKGNIEYKEYIISL